ncbi:MAG: hypothetical protein NTZ26_04955 [Candidatus Aminicenantes bacterium]|nr:hypothetical protein [Candidatus Aminicenantes bacterium]
MKAIQKLGIFAAALVLSLIGFSLIASPSVGMLQIGKQAGNEIIANYLQKIEAPPVFITVRG